jgi:lipid II:glycine glycyltransferase (peptidoglycan interpeptide bridge formation enzyme)
MIFIRGRGAVYGELWFEEDPPADSGVDIFLYFQRKTPFARRRCTEFLSLVTDLSVEEEAIKADFGKDCRYKIRRAESKDGLHMEFFAEPKSRLDEFRAFYDAFAKQKSLESSDHQWLVSACNAHQLALSLATRHDEALVWHAYVICGKTARLQYTGSYFRNRENEYRALVGRANRWLHWQDMLRFKEIGMTRYDWGGLFEDESVPERAGINQFKKDFGGRQERTYNCTVPVTFTGRVWLPLREVWRHRQSVFKWHNAIPQRPLTS